MATVLGILAAIPYIEAAWTLVVVLTCISGIVYFMQGVRVINEKYSDRGR